MALKVLTGQSAYIDTTTPHGKLSFNVFAAFAEYERNLIVERTNAGLCAARAIGRVRRRRRKRDVTTLRVTMAVIADSTTKVKELAATLNITPTSFIII